MSTHTLVAQLLDDDTELTLVELCHATHAGEEQVRLWVLEGVLSPRGGAPEQWRFGAAALKRARVARTLTQELDVNTPGVALALDLMEQIEALKASLRRAGLG